MNPALKRQTSQQDEDKPSPFAVQGGAGEGAEDGVCNQGFVEAGARGGIGRRHLLDGMP